MPRRGTSDPPFAAQHLLSVSHSATLSPRVTRNDKYSKALVDTYATLRPHDPPLDQPVPSGPAQKFQVSSTQSSERGLLRLLIRQPLRVLALCSVEASGRYQIHVTLALEFDHAELDGLLAEFDGEEERLAIRMTDLTADFIQLQAYRLGVVAAPNPRGIFVEYMNDAQSVKAFVGREWIVSSTTLQGLSCSC